MSKGRRYNGEEKLNLKKVFGVILAIVIIIAFIIGIKQILKVDKNTMAKKNVELSYLTVYSNGNWGVINSSGDIIVEPANGEMIEIPNKTKPVFICTYDVNMADGTYKSKAINEKNQQLFTDYENIFTLQNYDDKTNLWYEENTLKVQKLGKYGLISIEGQEILPCNYDSITTLKGVKNSLIIKQGDKIGIANSNGKIIVPVEYTNINAIKNDYKNGYIVQNSESKFGVINPNGETVLECKYNNIKNIIDDKYYIVNEEDLWRVLSSDGAIYLEGKVANAVDMNNGNVIVNENGKFGIINIQTDFKVQCEYEGLTYIFDDKYIAKKDGKFGVININNEVVVDYKYSDILHDKSSEYIKAKNEDNTYDYIVRDLTVKFTAGDEITLPNGFIAIKNGPDTKYYTYKLEEKSNKDVYSSNTMFVFSENGKYGFVNKEGNVVVEAKYDDATEQNEYGYVAVKKDGKWGALNQEGNVVAELKYDLEGNEEIDFVGKWHVCADSNASYYSDVE